jgi:hypothetical protein
MSLKAVLIITIRFCRAVSRVNVELKTIVSETVSASIIRVDLYFSNRSLLQ